GGRSCLILHFNASENFAPFRLRHLSRDGNITEEWHFVLRNRIRNRWPAATTHARTLRPVKPVPELRVFVLRDLLFNARTHSRRQQSRPRRVRFIKAGFE